MTEPDPLEELTTLTAALRAHAELCALSGAVGLEPAQRPAERNEADTRAVEMRTSLPHTATAPQQPRAEHNDPPPAPAPNASDGAPPRTSLPLAAGAERLASLAREIAGARAVHSHRDRTQTVFARGTSSSGLCFIGEGPGADEDAQGFPFVGKAGQLLDRHDRSDGVSAGRSVRLQYREVPAAEESQTGAGRDGRVPPLSARTARARSIRR